MPRRAIHGMRSAQRLTASEDGAGPLPCGTRWSPTSAQRLTASEDGAGEFSRPELGAVLQVLNALRHQRTVQIERQGVPRHRKQCSTPYGIRGWCRRRRTAARQPVRGAQRLTASEDGAAGAGDVFPQCLGSCSTPYGIRGWCRPGFRHSGMTMRNVLNALRHQRMVQHGGRTKTRAGRRRAQRLTASEDGADQR